MSLQNKCVVPMKQTILHWLGRRQHWLLFERTDFKIQYSNNALGKFSLQSVLRVQPQEGRAVMSLKACNLRASATHSCETPLRGGGAKGHFALPDVSHLSLGLRQKTQAGWVWHVCSCCFAPNACKSASGLRAEFCRFASGTNGPELTKSQID